jgi:5-methylcytosine-specific restriction protein A
VWAGAEVQLAAKASEYTPSELLAWGTALVEALDQDGAEPDDRPPPQINELHLVRHRGRPGGTVKGRFDDAAMFDAIGAVVDAKAKPLTGEDDRSAAQRQAEALAEVCGFVLDRGDLPHTGGGRPHLNVLVRLEDLESRCRAAALDFGGTLSPESLRMLACDAAVVPVVMGGKGQPLDVGRLTRTIPDGLRRAVAARGAGCEFPGCGRPPSWCEVHHVRPWQEGGPTALHNLAMLCRVHRPGAKTPAQAPPTPGRELSPMHSSVPTGQAHLEGVEASGSARPRPNADRARRAGHCAAVGALLEMPVPRSSPLGACRGSPTPGRR